MLPPPTTPDTTTTGPVSSATPVTTGTTQPPSGERECYLFLSSQCLLYSVSLLSGVAPVNAGVIAGAVVAVIAIVLIVLIVLLIVGFLIYRDKGEKNHVIVCTVPACASRYMCFSVVVSRLWEFTILVLLYKLCMYTYVSVYLLGKHVLKLHMLQQVVHNLHVC